MPTTKAAWRYVNLGYSSTVANNDRMIIGVAPCAGTIKECWVGINTILTTSGGTLAVAKNGVNILSSTTYNLGDGDTPDLVAATPEKATLTTATGTLKVAAGDLLKATWTLTTAASTNAGVCLIAIEPDEW